MAWGAYVQQGNLEELDMLGSELSKVLHCPVHYPAWNKNMFECKCEITFPVYMVKAAVETKDWSSVIEIHKNGGK